MKKKLLAVVSLLVAFVMSFCLLACGEKDNGKGGNSNEPPKLTGTTIENAVGDIANAKTLELDLTASVGSDKNKTEEVGGKVVISGNKLKYTDDGTSQEAYIYDFDTSYGYMIGEDGKCHYVDQAMPAGVMSYAYDVISSELGGSDATVDFSGVEEKFVYDETYGGFVLSADLKDYVNSVLKFAQDAYEGDMTLLDIADTLLKQMTEEENVSLEVLAAYICGEGFDTVKVMTLSQLLGENANETFNQLFDVAKEAGLEFTAAQKTAIKNRKIGELLAGVMAIAPTLEESEVDPEVILNALFFDEVSDKQIEAVASYLETAVDKAIAFLKETKFRDVIAEAPATIQAMVKTKGFAITELSAWLGVKVENNKFTEVKFAGKVSHNYSGTEYKDAEFVGDNNYAVNITVGIDTKDTATDFTVEYATDVEFTPAITVIVKGYEKGDCKVYFETAGKEITVSDMMVMFADVSSQLPAEVADAGVTFDAETSSFVIPEKTIASVVEKCKTSGSGNLMTYFTMTVDGVQQNGYVGCVVVVDKSVDVFSGIVSGLFGNMM